MNQLVVYPCCLANDGTTLKPAIEFDERLKENVGLTFNLDIDYIRKNPKPNTEFLKENLVTEAIVSSVISLDNRVQWSTLSSQVKQPSRVTVCS